MRRKDFSNQVKKLLNSKELSWGLILSCLIIIVYHGLHNSKYLTANTYINRYENIPKGSFKEFDDIEHFNKIRHQNQNEPFDFGRAKKILFFNLGSAMRAFGFGVGHEVFLDNKCPVTSCFATENHSLLNSLEDFDAIIFHMGKMRPKSLKIPDQSRRNPQQRYVMLFNESPKHDYWHRDYHRLKNFFNWTMTYRADSDIPIPYGVVEPKNNLYKYPPKWNERVAWMNYDENVFMSRLKTMDKSFWKLAQRPKKVAWMVSNCRATSGRESYVRELQKHIEIDILGKCGNITCEKTHWKSGDNCTKTLERDYKFYLSFENSFCDQYITEKLYFRLRQSLLPIVMGSGNYSDVAPPHSYINVLDFSSPKTLAEYILELDKNDEKYLSYFWWQDFYQVTHGYTKPLCRLCEMLNNPDEPGKVYGDLTDWWIEQANCKNKDTFPWLYKCMSKCI